MINDRNLSFTSTIYFGDAREPVKMIWDTGSSQLIVEIEDCSNCIGDLYDTSDDAGTFTPIPNSDDTVYYGSATASGYGATDKVCLVPDLAVDACVTSFPLFAVT